MALIPVTIYGSPFTAAEVAFLTTLADGGVGTSYIYNESPVGFIDGVNEAYTTLHTITTVIRITINGQDIDPTQYTVTGAGFTLSSPLPSSFAGTPFTIVYVTVSASSGTVSSVTSANSSATIVNSTTTPVITIVSSPKTSALSSATTVVNVSSSTAPTVGQVLTATSSTTATWQTIVGTVNTIAVATANGLAGTSSGGATPTLTLTTSVTGILQGDGTSITAKTSTGSGDVVLATSPTLITPLLGTPTSGNLTNCTFPTLNQNTAGKSAKTDALNSATTIVNVSASAAPSAGQALIATSATTATWQTLSGGGNALTSQPLSQFAATTSAQLISVISDETGSGFLVFNTSPTLTTPVINGSVSGSGVSANIAVSTIMLRDANANTNANSFIAGIAKTTTAGGTTTLTASSTYNQFFYGTANQTVVLPVTSTLNIGQQFMIVNDSTGTLTINSSGGNTFRLVGPNDVFLATCTLTSGTGISSWDYQYHGWNIASGKVGSLNNTLTFAGTDGTTMTFPTSSATLARTDNSNVFTGTQTVSTLTAPTNASINVNAGTNQTIQTYTPAGAGTATIDLSKGNVHHITMPAGNITTAISNATAGQFFVIRILQDGTGSRLVTWFSTIRWAGGNVPVLTTTANKADTFGFECTGTGTYDGYIVGQAI